MIYYFLYELLYTHFKDKDWYLVKALNVFQYVTFRTAYAAITALLISLFFGGKLIEALKQWNVGQQIREEGPQGHQVKRGTPTMGGVLIVGSVLISTLLWARLSSVYVWTAMIATLLFAAIGFVDDYAKMAKKQQSGFDRQAEVAGAVTCCSRRLGSALHFDEVDRRDRLFMEPGHSVFQSLGSSIWKDLYRSLYLFAFDRHRAAWIVQRSESH